MPRKYRKIVAICRHCKRMKTMKSKGLCNKCCCTPSIHKQYKSLSKFCKGHEPTEQELRKMIKEQMSKLPKWWEKEDKKQRGPERDELNSFVLPVRTKICRISRQSHK